MAKAANKNSAKNAAAHYKMKLGNFAYLHRLAAGIALLAFFVIAVRGFQVDAPMNTRVINVVVQAAIAMLAIKLITRVVVQIFKTYEEMNRGQS